MRRQQLIESTIAVLARKGYAGLTIADVAKEAGLSAGIVIFHFNSKDELLAAVLGALAAEYRSHWAERMEAAGPAAADRLKALLLSDFDTEVYTREKLAAWVAFWGEIQGRPFYDQICAGSTRNGRPPPRSCAASSLPRAAMRLMPSSLPAASNPWGTGCGSASAGRATRARSTVTRPGGSCQPHSPPSSPALCQAA